jgi:hypothetical protein
MFNRRAAEGLEHLPCCWVFRKACSGVSLRKMPIDAKTPHLQEKWSSRLFAEIIEALSGIPIRPLRTRAFACAITPRISLCSNNKMGCWMKREEAGKDAVVLYGGGPLVPHERPHTTHSGGSQRSPKIPLQVRDEGPQNRITAPPPNFLGATFLSSFRSKAEKSASIFILLALATLGGQGIRNTPNP